VAKELTEIEKEIESGELENASEDVRAAIKENPSNSEAYYIYGQILYKKAMFSEAALLFEIANIIEENPKYLFNCFLSYLMLDQIDMARSVINQAMLLNKNETLRLINDFLDRAYDQSDSISEEEKKMLRIKVKIFADNFD